jgi:DNA mismatch repair ATPase MutS
MENTNNELLPCPFCGEQPEHDYFPISNFPHEIVCAHCIGVVSTQKKTFEEAAAAWNRRITKLDKPLYTKDELVKRGDKIAELEARISELEEKIAQKDALINAKAFNVIKLLYDENEAGPDD